MTRLLEDGPSSYWSTELGPTPGQYRAIAHAACELLGIPAPTSRLDATSALARILLGHDVITTPQDPC